MDETFLIVGIFPLILLIIGLIFIFISRHRIRKIQNWALTEGEIIKKGKHINISILNLLNKNVTDPKAPDKAPTVKFSVDGETYEYTSSMQQTPGIAPGTIVELYYNPNNPKEAIINTFAQKGTVFKLVGWILTLIGISAIMVIFIVYLLNK